MSVDSYLELFTTLFGWTFYGILWDVLVGTGIVFLPFLGILIDNWREPAEGGEFGTVTGLSLRRMELELFIALLVVVLAGQPAALTPLNAASLNYTPPPTLIDPTPPTATVAAPQSTYGSTGFTGSPATVNIPVWWYAVLSMTSGFNHAVVEGLPSAADMRTYEQQARLATIADPRLRQEVSDFFSQCYIPARSRYQTERPATAAVNALLDNLRPRRSGLDGIACLSGYDRVTTTPCAPPRRSVAGPTMLPAIPNMILLHHPPGAGLTVSSGGKTPRLACVKR